MRFATRHLLLATLSSLSLAVAVPAHAQKAAVAAPAIDAAPLAKSVPSQLPRIARPSHYDIAITPDAEGLTFTGRVAIDLDLFESSNSITMNALDLSFAGASLSKADGSDTVPLMATLDAADQTVTFVAPAALAPGKYRLTADYTGVINTQANGLFALDYPDKATGEPRRGLFTQFEAADARRFVPSFDEPSYKASFTLTATVPADQLAVSNMPAEREAAAANGMKTVHFGTSPRMSSYLLFFGAGDFERMAKESESGVEVGIVSPRGSSEQARFALDSLAPLLTYYTDYFGQPYPLPKLDNIAGPGQSQFFGAMENWGAIFTFERILLDDPAITSEATRQAIYGVQAHEVAHQWFGDLVTMAWWDDLWLNEGFASWMATKVTDHFHPEWQPLLLRVGGRESAMGLDAYQTTHPILQTIRTVEDTNQAFDAITYRKGEAVISMLEAYAGEDVWRDGLRRYMAAHKYENSRTDDLWNAIEAAGAKGLTAIAHDFTGQPGIPLIRMTGSKCKGGINLISVTQGEFSRDRRGTIDSETRRWQVPMLVRTIGGKEQRIVVRDGKASIKADNCGATILNGGQLGYFRTLYTGEALDALRRAFSSIEPIDQLGLLSDNFALSVAGYQPMGAALGLLAAVPGDASPYVLIETADRYAQLYGAFDGDAATQATIAARGAAALRPALTRLGFDPKDGEPALDAVLRADVIRALGTMGDAAVLGEARRRFALLDSDPRALDGSAKGLWLDIVAANASAADWDKLRRLAQASKSAVERSTLYTLLGAPKDDALAQRALDLSLTGEPGQTVSAAIIGRVAGYHAEAAVAFVEAHQAEVDKLTDASARVRFLASLALNSNDPAMIAALETKAAALPADVRKPYERTIAVLKEQAESRPRIQAETRAWLASQ